MVEIPDEPEREVLIKMAQAFMAAERGIGDKSPMIGPLHYAYLALVKYYKSQDN